MYRFDGRFDKKYVKVTDRQTDRQMRCHGIGRSCA